MYIYIETMQDETRKCAKCKNTAPIQTYKILRSGTHAKTCDTCLTRQREYAARPDVRAKKAEYNKVTRARVKDNWDEYYEANRARFAKNAATYYQRVTKAKREAAKAAKEGGPEDINAVGAVLDTATQ